MKRGLWVGFVALICLSFAPLLAQEARPQSGRLSDSSAFQEVPLRISRDGETLIAEMRATSGNLDPLLLLVDENGVIVAENDDLSPDDASARIIYPQAMRGQYTLVATRYGVRNGTSTGDYDLSIRFESASRPQVAYDLSPEALIEAGYPELEVRPRADWTIIAYFGGDTNLEPGVMNDFNEFELAGGSDEQVRIVALLDRHPEFSTASGDWQTGRLFEIEADVSGDEFSVYPPTLDSEALADLGRVNTGSGETLARFLAWSLRHYPAERYAIVLASHGGGWQGVISDDSEGGTLISLPELEAAFASAREIAGVERFDLLINDACSMGSLEYSTTLSTYFDASLASPEVVVNPALDMRLLAETLREEPEIGLADIAKVLIDAYIDRDTSQRNALDRNYLNFSLTDMHQVRALTEAVESFARLLNAEAYRNGTLIGTARANTYTYSAFFGADSRIDLQNFMQQILSQDLNPELAEAAQAVLDALEPTLIYGRSAPRLESIIGYLSLYFPQNGQDFDAQYLDNTPLVEWSRWLRNYFVISAPRLWSVDDSIQAFHPPIAPRVKVTRIYPQDASTLYPPAVSVEIVGRRIANGAFTIDRVRDDGSVVRLAQRAILTESKDEAGITLRNQWRAGIDQSTFYWLPFSLPQVTDGTTSAFEYLTQRGEVTALEGRYRGSAQSDWREVTLLFSSDGQVQSAITTDDNGALASIRLLEGDEFQSYIPVVGADGTTKREVHVTYQWGTEGLGWTSAPTPSGDYRLGFLVQAFGGATGFDSVEVNVENELSTQNQNWVGYTDIQLSLNFEHPADWSSVLDYGNWLNTTSPDGLRAINIYHFPAEENVYTILRETLTRYGLQQEGEARTLEWQGSFGLYFDHRYQNDDGTQWRGRALVLWRQTLLGGRALVFSVDTQAVDEAPNPASIFRSTLDRMRFIDADALARNDASEWRYTLLDGRIPFPIRRDWSRQDDLTTGWTVLRPINGISRLQVASVARVARIEGADPDSALQTLLERYAPEQDTTLRTYSGEYYDWQSASYVIFRRERDSQGRIYEGDIYGRLYVTRVNDELYAWRFETPNDEQASQVFRQIYEPMLDGFAPPQDVSFATGARDAFVKAGMVTMSQICQNIAYDELCLAGDSQARLLYGDGRLESISQAGTRRPLRDIRGIEVGIDEAGQVQPTASVVLRLRANIPERDAPQDILILAFGGTTLINRSLLDQDQSAQVPIFNETDIRLALRQAPNSDAPSAGAMPPRTQLTAVARTEDGEWLRVRLPLREGQTGWVSREFIVPSVPNQSLDVLPIGDPSRPHYVNGQALEVYLHNQVAEGGLGGLLLQTRTLQQPVNLELNGTPFIVNPDSLFVWNADSNTLESLSVKEDVFELRSERRRPEGWTSATQAAPVRVQAQGEMNPDAYVPLGNLFVVTPEATPEATAEPSPVPEATAEATPEASAMPEATPQARTSAETTPEATAEASAQP